MPTAAPNSIWARHRATTARAAVPCPAARSWAQIDQTAMAAAGAANTVSPVKSREN